MISNVHYGDVTWANRAVAQRRVLDGGQCVGVTYARDFDLCASTRVLQIDSDVHSEGANTAHNN